MDTQQILQGGEQAMLRLRELYRRHGYLPYKMSKFEAYDLYVRNKSFLVSEQVLTFTDLDGVPRGLYYKRMENGWTVCITIPLHALRFGESSAVVNVLAVVFIVLFAVIAILTVRNMMKSRLLNNIRRINAQTNDMNPPKP